MATSGTAPKPEEGGPFCVACGTSLQAKGLANFRIGGTTGGWKLLLGEWAELGEGMLGMEVLVCPSCRRVELRMPQR